MATGTKTRLFTKLLDAVDAPLWVISPSGRLVYLSAGCADWLGVAIESLVDRQSIAGAAVSDDPLDQLAASLSPPPGMSERGTASLKIQPPMVGTRRPPSLEVRFVRVGDGDQALTIAVGGRFADREIDHELRDAVAIRQRLDAWRKQHAAWNAIITAGDSAAARRLRRRLQVAASVRTDFACLGPAGSGSESIATRIHQLSCPGEPIITIDGPLMDAELLDASLSSIMRPLSDSPAAQATALLRGLDETPSDAQQRLAEILATFGGRLRLIGLCGSKAGESPQEQSAADTVPSPIQEATIDVGVDTRLSETLSALIITIDPLASRVSDLPAMATALLDRMRAAGHTAAERFNRAALDAIVIYPWPNNFEELREAVRHAARRAEGPAIGIEHLPLAIRSFRSGEQPRPPKPSAVSLDQAVARFERQLIEQAIAASDGNRAAAARQLGISRARLLRKIAESEANRSGH